MKYDVCVFGGCSLDLFYYKDEHGNTPFSPSLLVPGGKGANQAVAASRAGASVTIITRIGKDKIGNRIIDNLSYNGVSTNNIEVSDSLQNDYAKIIIDEKSKDNDIHRFSGVINSFRKEMVDRYKDVILNSKMIVCQLKVPKEVTSYLINFCYENKKPLVLTPCRPEKLKITEDDNLDLINKVTYITANKKECETLFNTSDIISCIKKYPNKLIVTLGSDGVMYYDGFEVVHVPAFAPKKIEDTTGAGDTFNGNLVACLTKGYTLYEAVVRACYASSMKISKKGAQDGMPYKEELDKYIENYSKKL